MSTFWEVLDDVLALNQCATGDSAKQTSQQLAEAIAANPRWQGGPLTSFDVERELRGNYAAYANWAISDYGDHWLFLKR
ncbi:MAG: hypothetical protein Q8Q09_23450 [Deltaproteobacteria bacterium]|nr:hypothetical protein [Deltaproteobacteria bacterium]